MLETGDAFGVTDKQIAPFAQTLIKFTDQLLLGRTVEIDHDITAEDGVKWVSDLVSELNIPPLSAHGMSESQIPEAVEKTLNASSFKGNPIALNEGELREILLKAM